MSHWLASTALAVWVLTASQAYAGGDSDFLLKSRPKGGDTGEQVDLPIRLDVNLEEVFAWTIAVCHDPEIVSIDSVTNGAVLDTINEGELPDFDDITFYDEGFVAGVIVCITTCDSLPTGEDYELYSVTYNLDALAPSESAIEFCEDTLGVVSNELVLDGGDAVTPETIDTTISILGPIPLWFTLSMPDVERYYDVGDGLVGFDQPVSLLEDDDNPTYPNAIEAMTLTVTHDSAVLEATDAVSGSDLNLVNDGAGPDFFSVEYLDDATVMDIVVSDAAADGLVVDESSEVAVVTYEGVTAILLGFPFGITTDLSFEVDDESEVSPNQIDSGEYLVGFVYENASATLIPREQFLRGDVNDDNVVDFLDATDLLDRLYGDGDPIVCLSAADLDESLAVNLVDPIYLLAYVFLDGDPPPAPYPTCGFDDAEDSSCGEYESCP